MRLAMAMRDRLFLLVAGVLSAYQVAVGIEGLSDLAIICYTLAFGVLLVASLVLIILGYEALDSPAVVIVATVLPLSLSAGLVAQHLPSWTLGYLVFAGFGFAAVAISRLISLGRVATVVLAVVHGTAGLVITGVPLWTVAIHRSGPAYLLVALGGVLIGLGGLLLTFFRMGKPLIAGSRLMGALPLLLLLTGASFTAGMSWGG